MKTAEELIDEAIGLSRRESDAVKRIARRYGGVPGEVTRYGATFSFSSPSDASQFEDDVFNDLGDSITAGDAVEDNGSWRVEVRT